MRKLSSFSFGGNLFRMFVFGGVVLTLVSFSKKEEDVRFDQYRKSEACFGHHNTCCGSNDFIFMIQDRNGTERHSGVRVNPEQEITHRNLNQLKVPTRRFASGFQSETEICNKMRQEPCDGIGMLLTGIQVFRMNNSVITYKKECLCIYKN